MSTFTRNKQDYKTAFILLYVCGPTLFNPHVTCTIYTPLSMLHNLRTTVDETNLRIFFWCNPFDDLRFMIQVFPTSIWGWLATESIMRGHEILEIIVPAGPDPVDYALGEHLVFWGVVVLIEYLPRYIRYMDYCRYVNASSLLIELKHRVPYHGISIWILVHLWMQLGRIFRHSS